jgi:hypothetical protein
MTIDKARFSGLAIKIFVAVQMGCIQQKVFAEKFIDPTLCRRINHCFNFYAKLSFLKQKFPKKGIGNFKFWLFLFEIGECFIVINFQ